MDDISKGTRVRVPGKLYIAGEYAVVEGAPAIVVAVDQYLQVTIRPSDDFGSLETSHSSGLRLTWRRTEKGATLVGQHAYQLIEQAVRLAENYLGIQTDGEAPCYHIKIDSQLDNDQTGAKYGLGSSGAVTVAIIRAVLTYFGLSPDPMLTYKLAVLTQLTVGLEGSFGDLAASSFGGWIAYCRPDKEWLLGKMADSNLRDLLALEWPHLLIEPLNLPDELSLLVGWTQSVASTEVLVGQMKERRKKVDKAKEHQQFIIKSRACLDDLIGAFQARDVQAIQAGLRHNRQLLRDYAQALGLVIETPELSRLISCAEANGAVAKSSGAGGGDCGICLVTSRDQARAIQVAWQAQGIVPLKLKPAPVFNSCS